MYDIIAGILLKPSLHYILEEENAIALFSAISSFYTMVYSKNNKCAFVFLLCVLGFDIYSFKDSEKLYSVILSHFHLIYSFHNNFTKRDKEQPDIVIFTVFKFLIFFFKIVNRDLKLDSEIYNAVNHIITFFGLFADIGNQTYQPNLIIHGCSFIYDLILLFYSNKYTDIKSYKILINDLSFFIYLNDNGPNEPKKNDIISSIV